MTRTATSSRLPVCAMVDTFDCAKAQIYHNTGKLTPAQIKAQEKAEARARARAVRRGSKEKTVLGEYRSELARSLAGTNTRTGACLSAPTDCRRC